MTVFGNRSTENLINYLTPNFSFYRHVETILAHTPRCRVRSGFLHSTRASATTPFQADSSICARAGLSRRAAERCLATTASKPTATAHSHRRICGYPTAQRTANPDQVLSPYEPYNVIDVAGFKSGQLARDPSNQKIFRIP